MDDDDEFTWFMKVIEKKDPDLLLRKQTKEEDSPTTEATASNEPSVDAANDTVEEEYNPETDTVLAGLISDLMNAPATAAEQARVDAYQVAHAEKLRLRAENESKLKQSNIAAVATALHERTLISTNKSPSQTTTNSIPIGRTLDKSPLGAVVSWAQTNSLIPATVKKSRGEQALQQHMMLHMALTQDSMSAEELDPALLVDRREESKEVEAETKNVPVSTTVDGGSVTDKVLTLDENHQSSHVISDATETRDTLLSSDDTADNDDDRNDDDEANELTMYLNTLRHTVLRQDRDDASIAQDIIQLARTLAATRDDNNDDNIDKILTSLPISCLRVSVWARVAWMLVSAVKVTAGGTRGMARVTVESEEREMARSSLSKEAELVWMTTILTNILMIVVEKLKSSSWSRKCSTDASWSVAGPLYLRHLTAHMQRYTRNAVLARFVLQPDVHYSIETSDSNSDVIMLIPEEIEEIVGEEGDLVALYDVLALKHSCAVSDEAEEVFFSCVIELNESSPEINADVD